MSKRILREALLTTLVAAGYAHTAPAQTDTAGASSTPEARPSNETLGEIVVTGSRLTTTGASLPTPVAVLSAHELESRAPQSIPEALNRLPQIRGSERSNDSLGFSADMVRYGGGDYLNLRNLGVNRNLILLDGHRVPPTSSTGAVDANTLPQMLVERVDVVTGGVSAVYGSDAVSGVVNYVLDRHFEGLRATVQGGMSSRDDGENYRVGIAGGAGLFEDRLHVIGSYERFHTDGIGSKTERKVGRDANGNYQTYGTVGSGTAEDPYRMVSNAHYTFATFGGLVSSGPLAYTSTFLPDGTLGPFEINPVSFAIETGGMGAFIAHDAPVITAPYTTDQAFTRLSFEVTPELIPYVQVAYGRTETRFHPWQAFYFCPGYQCATFFPENAFLRPEVRDALGNEPFSISRVSIDQPYDDDEATTRSVFASAGIDGQIGSAWSWNINYSHGDARLRNDVIETQSNKYFAAVDAVVDDDGNTVCRVTLTNPGLYPGCVPFNPFGVGAPSSAAEAYIRGHSLVEVTNKMDLLSADVRGPLFDIWAGPVSGAFGVEYREQTLTQTSNSNPAEPFDFTGLRAAPPNAQHFMINNNGLADGSVNVKEAFGEIIVPLARDTSFARLFELNGAVRYTDYSTSGGVTTYKIGATYEPPVSWLRFRAATSRDIRAPNLYELFAGNNVTISGLVDVHTGTSGAMIYETGGNVELDPEVGRTHTAGVVITPTPDLTLSIDAYWIEIEDAIAQLDGVDIVNECERTNGTGPTCALVNRPLPFSDRTAANRPTSVSVTSLNLASLEQSGIDLDLSYRMPLASLGMDSDGSVFFRAFATYLLKADRQQSATLPVIHYAGFVDNERWRADASLGFEAGGFMATLSESYVSRSGISPIEVWENDPRIPSAFYTDLDLQYELPWSTAQVSAFLNVRNLFDKQSPVLPALADNPGIALQTYRQKFDPTGMFLTAGVRVRF